MKSVHHAVLSLSLAPVRLAQDHYTMAVVGVFQAIRPLWEV
jgi:hypothetical protein